MRRFNGIPTLLTLSALLVTFVALPTVALGQGSGVDQYFEDVPGGGGGSGGGASGGGGGSPGGGSGGGGGAATTDPAGAATTGSDGAAVTSGDSSTGSTESGLTPSVSDEADDASAPPPAEPTESAGDNGEAHGNANGGVSRANGSASTADHDNGGVPLGDVLKDTAGGSGSGGLGLALPIILGIVVLALALLVVARHRSGGPGGTLQRH